MTQDIVLELSLLLSGIDILYEPLRGRLDKPASAARLPGKINSSLVAFPKPWIKIGWKTYSVDMNTSKVFQIFPYETFTNKTHCNFEWQCPVLLEGYWRVTRVMPLLLIERVG